MKNKLIDQVTAEFKKWRQAGNGPRARIPNALQLRALQLQEDYRNREICEALGIYPTYLRRWRKNQKPQSKKPSFASRATDGAVTREPLRFIEIAAPAPIRTKMTAPTLALEWQRSDGARMRLSSADLDVSQLERLVGRFLAPAALEGQL